MRKAYLTKFKMVTEYAKNKKLNEPIYYKICLNAFIKSEFKEEIN